MKRILKKVKNFHISHLVKLLQTFIRNSIDCMNEHLDVRKNYGLQRIHCLSKSAYIRQSKQLSKALTHFHLGFYSNKTAQNFAKFIA